MRICNKCQVEKPLCEYYSNKASTNQKTCKQCKKTNQKINYEKDKSKAAKQRDRRRMELKEFVREQKNKPCLDCGGIFHPNVLEYDHRESDQKTDAVAYLAHRCFSKNKILEEIAKCDLVCSNCHRKRTAFRGRWFKPLKNKTAAKNRTISDLKRSGSCEICFQQFEPYQMDFDHLEPEDKRKPVSLMVATNYSTKAVLEEMDKCRILCSNCHKAHTMGLLESMSILKKGSFKKVQLEENCKLINKWYFSGICKFCPSENFIKWGKYKNSPVLKCKDCNRTFIANQESF